MKKVGILHYAYPPNIGGVEILIREHAGVLSDLGYDVTVVTGAGQEKSDKIKLVVIPEIQSILRFNPALYEKIVEKGVIDSEFHQLVKVIGNKLSPLLDQLDTVIIHNMMTLVHNLAFNQFIKNYIKSNPNKRFIFWTHDQTFIDGENILDKKEGVNLSKEEMDILMTPVENATYVAISETFKKLLCQVIKVPLDKVKVIYDGVNLKKFLEIDDSIWKVVIEKNLLSNFPLVLSPVNILARKRLDLAIQVISNLKNDYPEIKYIITGQPSAHRKDLGYLESLKKLIADLGLSDNIIFLRDYFSRSLTDTEMHDLYDLSDIVFIFSKSENFGLPIIETAFTKTPALVTNLQVFQEIGAENLSYFNPKNSVEEIAALARDILKNNKTLLMKKTAMARFNLESIIKNDLAPLL